MKARRHARRAPDPRLRGSRAGGDRRRAVVAAALAVACLLGGCRGGLTRGEIRFADGLDRLATGDTLAARRFLEGARYDLHDDPRVLYHLARLRAREGTIEGRVAARRYLEEAIHRSPDRAAYHLELGQILWTARYDRASKRELARSVALDPNCQPGWRDLGLHVLHEALEDPEHPALEDSALACLTRAVALDPGDRAALEHLAFLHLHRGELESARQLLEDRVAAVECPGRLAMLLAAVAFHQHRFAAAQGIVDRALACMSWKERAAWVGIRSLLHPDDTSLWKVWTPAQQDSASRAWWWERDPTPTTRVNERFVEHVARVVEAWYLFSLPRLGREGPTTDRGEIYVRYGSPSRRTRIARANVPAWRWVYRAPGDEGSLNFKFFDRYFNGDYMRERRTATSDFSVFSALERYPPQSRLRFRSPERPVRWHTAFFRGGAGRTAIEVAWETGGGAWGEIVAEVAGWLGPEDLHAQDRRRWPRQALHARAGDRWIGRMRLEMPPGRTILGGQLLAVRASAGGAAAPARAASLRESLWMSMLRDTLQVPRFDPFELGLSDILLAHEMGSGDRGRFDLGGTRVVPRVDRTVRGERLDLYFEIYPSRTRLAAAAPLAVTWEVRSLPPRTWSFWDQFKPEFHHRFDPNRRPAVESTFSFVPESDRVPQLLTLDLSALPPGPYAITVRVTDPVTGDAVARSIDFDRVPPDS